MGNWEIVRRVGRGGTATVYSVIHRLIGKRAALKIVRPELADHADVTARFVREARIANLIAHPDVIDIFAVDWHDDGRIYLVMEFLIGRSLSARRSDGGLDADEAIEILARLCRPLACAHAHGVVHRDLKPDNVFLCDERVKLLDWGLSAQMDATRACPAERSFVGTPHYAAPEQSCGLHVDERADVFALGITARELFGSAMPRALDAIVTAMVATRAADRPRLAEVQTALAELSVRDARAA